MANNKKIFLDINVVIDFLEHSRQRHTKTVALIEYLTNHDYNICISEDMLTTIYYISTNKKAVLLFLKTIVTNWQILHFGKETIQDAIKASLEQNSDLEDSLQCFCAAANGCNTLVTHDKTFYPNSSLFLKKLYSQISVDFDITYMTVLIFSKNLDLRKNAYSQTAS